MMSQKNMARIRALSEAVGISDLEFGKSSGPRRIEAIEDRLDALEAIVNAQERQILAMTGVQIPQKRGPGRPKKVAEG